MKKMVGFTVVFFAILLSVAMPPVLSKDILRVDNDVGYVLDAAEEIATIPAITNDIQTPELTMETCLCLKYSIASPVVCSANIELGAGIYSNAALVYDNLYHQGNRHDKHTCNFPIMNNSRDTKEITDCEGLYRLDIGEYLRQK